MYNPKIRWAMCILIFLIPSPTFFPSSFSSFLLLFQTFYGGSLTYVEFNSKGICYLALLFYRVEVTYYLNINPVKKGVWLFKRLLISHVTVFLCLLMKLRVEFREQSFLFSMLFPLTVLMTTEMTLLGKETQSQACISGLLLLFSHSVMSSALQPRVVGSSVLHFSWSLLRFLSFELVTPSNHLILCSPLLLLPSFISRGIFGISQPSLYMGPTLDLGKLKRRGGGLGEKERKAFVTLFLSASIACRYTSFLLFLVSLSLVFITSFSCSLLYWIDA